MTYVIATDNGVHCTMCKLSFYCIKCDEMLVMNPIINTLSNNAGFYALVVSECCIGLEWSLNTTF